MWCDHTFKSVAKATRQQKELEREDELEKIWRKKGGAV